MSLTRGKRAKLVIPSNLPLNYPNQACLREVMNEKDRALRKQGGLYAWNESNKKENERSS